MFASVDYRATSHTTTCEHPHADCYCGTHWNGAEAKAACRSCETAALYTNDAATAGPPDDVAVCEVCGFACPWNDYNICDHGVTHCFGCLCRDCAREERRP